MAFAGLHIEFSTVGVEARNSDDTSPLSIYGTVLATDTIASPGTSTVLCPQPPSGHDTVMATIKVSADSWVTLANGTPDNPATVGSKRRLVYAGVPLDQECQPGDVVRWSAA